MHIVNSNFFFFLTRRASQEEKTSQKNKKNKETKKTQTKAEEEKEETNNNENSVVHVRKKGGHLESPGRKHELKLLWTYSSYCKFSSSYLCLPSLSFQWNTDFIIILHAWYVVQFVPTSIINQSNPEYKRIYLKLQTQKLERTGEAVVLATGSIIFLEKKGKKLPGKERTGLDVLEMDGNGVCVYDCVFISLPFQIMNSINTSAASFGLCCEPHCKFYVNFKWLHLLCCRGSNVWYSIVRLFPIKCRLSFLYEYFLA